jgi:hypothetical protein
MAYKYTVTSKMKDPTNGNIVITADFVDDALPSVVYTFKTFGFDLTDAFIDDWAGKTINVLMTRDANFPNITVGVQTIPRAPVVSPVASAQGAFMKASEAAQVKARNDPDEMAAYAALIALDAQK